MPVGVPTAFEGDISLIEKNPFGFFEVEIEAPLGLHAPILQTKLKSGNLHRTVAPVGTWVGTYFSEELKEALILGYKYKILRGYLFDRENIFKEFVLELYTSKEKSEKGSAEYIIYKTLLNSLYGRFGMSTKMENHLILDSSLALEYHDEDRYIVTNTLDLISFFDRGNVSILDGEDSKNRRKLNISVPISSAITSYARIFMSKFKNLPDVTLYYSDTDSIYIDKVLDSIFVSNTELGKFKLERIFERAAFLTPKMYGGLYFSSSSKDENRKLTEYIKVKGVKSTQRFYDILPLLFKDQIIKIEQEKWFRDVEKATIKVFIVEGKEEGEKIFKLNLIIKI